MDRIRDVMRTLTSRNDAMLAEIEDLKNRLALAQGRLQALGEWSPDGTSVASVASEPAAEVEVETEAAVQESGDEWKWPLEREEYERYSRQLLVPGVGVEGQLKLKNASILIVGGGGLGCPAAMYLAGAGVGRIGIMDGDVVEASNLHRQIGHSTWRVGMHKVESLTTQMQQLNPLPTYTPHPVHLSADNAHEVVPYYDLILDCTDRPSTRYLVSDAAVAYAKPLISASALRTDGQLLVLNHPALPAGDSTGGPCYRCVFPKPPPAETVQGCGEGGVLGMAVGVMGVLQALEAVKLIVDIGEGVEAGGKEMLLFSGLQNPRFRSVRMSGKRRAGCVACSATATLTPESLRAGSVDYEAFCGFVPSVRLLGDKERISATQLAEALGVGRKDGDVLLDVREAAHFAVASLPGAVNVPAARFLQRRRISKDADTSGGGGGGNGDSTGWWLPEGVKSDGRVFVVCRVGNDSQVVAKRLMEDGWKGEVVDVKGGMRAWRDEVDETLPFL